MKNFKSIFCMMFISLSFHYAHALSDDEIGYSVTGSWYNPATSGQGLNFIYNPIAGDVGSITLYWYTYTKAGIQPPQKLWFVAQGTITDFPMVYDLTYIDNATFLALNTNTGRKVGTVTLTMSTCSDMQMSWNITDSTVLNLINNGTQGLKRLSPFLTITDRNTGFVQKLCPLDGDVTTPPPPVTGYCSGSTLYQAYCSSFTNNELLCRMNSSSCSWAPVIPPNGICEPADSGAAYLAYCHSFDGNKLACTNNIDTCQWYGP